MVVPQVPTDAVASAIVSNIKVYRELRASALEQSKKYKTDVPGHETRVPRILFFEYLACQRKLLSLRDWDQYKELISQISVLKVEP